MENRGFTLIEMMVSLAIFAVVAVIAIGALLKIVTADQKAQSIQSAVTNLNYVVESISREIRQGDTFSCDVELSQHDCAIGDPAKTYPSSGKSIIAFNIQGTDSDGTSCPLEIAYQVINSGGLQLQKAQQTNCGAPLDSSDPDLFTNILTMNSNNVFLTDYRFGIVKPNIASSASYPMAYIRFVGYAGTNQRNQTDFDIQTSIGERTRAQ